MTPFTSGKGFARGCGASSAWEAMRAAFLFKLQERIREMDRVELIARRVDRFTREEAACAK